MKDGTLKDPEVDCGRYIGRNTPTGERALWWAPPQAAPWEPLPAIRHHSPDGPNWGYAGNGPLDAAEAILLHATADPVTARRYGAAFRAALLEQQPTDRELSLSADTVERWLDARGIALAPGWSAAGPQPVVEWSRTTGGVERYTVALDGWDFLRIDLPGREPIAVVGVTDLKSRRELRWSAEVAVAEPGDDHRPASAGERVAAESLPFGAWAVMVEGFDVAIVERDASAGTDVRVAVYDRRPESQFLVFDEFVRYRQLSTEPVAIGELLRCFGGTSGRGRVRGA
jgi:hypothetical protein